MFIKSDIRKVFIALEKMFFHEVFDALGKEGIIHLSHTPRADLTTDEGLKTEEEKTGRIILGIQYVMDAMDILPGRRNIPETGSDIDSDSLYVEKIKRTVDRLVKLHARIRDALDEIDARLSYRKVLQDMGVDADAFKGSRLTRMIFGTVEEIDWRLPEGMPFQIVKSGHYVAGAALPGEFPRMMHYLSNYGFYDLSNSLGDGSIETLDCRRRSLKTRVDVLNSYFLRLKQRESERLQDRYRRYKKYEEVMKALRMSLFSSKAMFITGWIDIREKERLSSLLRSICGDRFIVAVSETHDPDAPVQLINIGALKPFELIVKTMGMPGAREIDPTPLAALTFVLMFGLMFGDLGQGVVLALVGVMLHRSAKKKGDKGSALGQSGAILVACGLAAAICGMLYGSVFSNEHLIPAMLFHPMTHIMSLFSLTIVMGACIIAVGLCVNIINCVINARYTEAFFEKRGLAILVLYVAVVFFALRYAATGEGMSLWYGGLFLLLPLIIFSFRCVLGSLLFGEEKPHSVVEYMIETSVEILETGLSMLANTVSFIRVGAFALSHAGLSIVTYTLAGIMDPAMKSPGAVIIIVAGNVFIIGFEALICGIQSMRLEYYEFFSKFFKGDGIVFSPFIFKAQASEV